MARPVLSCSSPPPRTRPLPAPSLSLPTSSPPPLPPPPQIRILDLVTNATSATVSHDSRVDWLELNSRGSLLLFRDKRRRLHLYDVARQQRSTLLSYCNYAQWVPDSDVVVAQRRAQLCVWYNIRAPEKMTSYDSAWGAPRMGAVRGLRAPQPPLLLLLPPPPVRAVKGDVEDIERGNGKTEVIVDEGITTASYMLDEGLIAFSEEEGRGWPLLRRSCLGGTSRPCACAGTAIDDGDLGGALSILEGLELTPETAAMWQQVRAAERFLRRRRRRVRGTASRSHPLCSSVSSRWRATATCTLLSAAPWRRATLPARASSTRWARQQLARVWRHPHCSEPAAASPPPPLVQTLKIASMAAQRLGGDGRDFWMVRGVGGGPA